jgi:HTH-type transcriptional repressor of NAD biosynthesis genes
MIKGLVVGKFMPLHRGHQLLIESALAQVDELTVVVYDSEPEGNYPAMPVHMRTKWVSKLYPQVHNIVARQDPLGSYTQEERDSPNNADHYANDISFLGPFDYVFSSEDYGGPFAAALGAKAVTVDAARTMLPISGTEIRENVYEHRGWVDPVVYRDLIRKVVFVGTESTGKSTLAKAMAEEMDTLWVHEFGRELWEEQGLTGTFNDLWKIAQNHHRREQAAMLHSREFLFCDTNPWTTLQWSLMYHGTADARLYDLVARTKNDYTWILCKNDIPWVQDGTRELFGEKANELQNQIWAGVNGITDGNYHTVYGSVENRIRMVKEILGIDIPVAV